MNGSSTKERQDFAMELISQACELMGWGIIPSEGDDTTPVYYMIIGTEEGLDMAQKRLDGEVQ